MSEAQLSGGPVRWGILSTAAINRRLLPAFRESPALELVAVASRSQERADEYAHAEGIPRAHGTYEALLDDPDVEAVYISLPNSLHVEWSILALDAGKHVLCEKPLDRRASEVERAFDTADRAARLLMEAFMYRHHPQTLRALELVRGGGIGELRLVRSSFGFTAQGAANVRLSADLDGGALMDVGCYCVSVTRLLAGEPESVAGRAVLGPTGVDLRFAGVLALPGSVLAHFDCGLDVPAFSVVEAVGSAGTLRIPRPFLISDAVIEHVHDGTVERIDVPAADSYRLELENMSAAIRGEAEPLLGRADALGQARALEALYASADGGGAPVSLAR
jgi:D-xylose 1-dehydrogenase (NADP+, D-xylono-1,5-lactone-forming)